MRVNENTYKAMPTELQALFCKCPNPGSEEGVDNGADIVTHDAHG